jgi:hypothetical protein
MPCPGPNRRSFIQHGDVTSTDQSSIISLARAFRRPGIPRRGFTNPAGSLTADLLIHPGHRPVYVSPYVACCVIGFFLFLSHLFYFTRHRTPHKMCSNHHILEDR